MIGHRLITALAVHRPQAVSDGVGGQIVTFTPAGEIRAQVNQPTPEERQTAQQRGVTLSHVLHTLYGADVARGDHLDGDLPSDVPDGHRLRVASAVSNSRRTYTRLECEITQAEEP